MKELIKKALNDAWEESDLLPNIETRLSMELEGLKSHPIEFAEWLSENQWNKQMHTHPSKVGKYHSYIHWEYKTIEELYGIFCNTPSLIKSI